MQIFIVLPPGGKTITIEVQKTDTIWNIKNKITEKDGITPEHQVLVYNGKTLDDSKNLSEYGIDSPVTIFLTLRLSGGDV